MPDVVVNIRGNSDQLKRELDGIYNQNPPSGGNAGGGNGIYNPPTNSGNSPPIGRGQADDNRQVSPPDNRLIESVRREISSQGAVFVPGSSNFRVLLNQAADGQRGRLNEEISQKYNSQRADLQGRMGSAYDRIDKQTDDEKESEYRRLGGSKMDPIRKQLLDKQFDAIREQRYETAGKKFDEEESSINSEESKEKAGVEEELAKVIRELTDEMKRGTGAGGGSDSYMGKLRDQRRQLVLERDSATDADGAMNASKRIAGIDDQLQRVMQGGRPQQGRAVFDSALTGGHGMISAMNAALSGDIGGTIMGGSMAVTGLSGMGLSAALKVNAVAAAVAAAFSGVNKISDKIEGLSGLSALRSASEGKRGDASIKFQEANLAGGRQYGLGYANFGLEQDQFADIAAKRMKISGSGANWFEEAMNSIGLEKSLALDQNSLVNASKYDRYGESSNDAIVKLVDQLEKIPGSGVSKEDFSRVQEKFDIQQSIMDGYMSRTDKPNFDTANKTLAAFSSIQGITQDSRLGSDIKDFQNLALNPKNDRMKAMLYQVVGDLFPAAAGRSDKIDQLIHDPKNEAKIIPGFVKRATQLYGSVDTQIGYWSMRNLLPNIAPDRMMKEVRTVANGGKFSKVLSDGVTGGGDSESLESQKQGYIKEGSEYSTYYTQMVKSFWSQTLQIGQSILAKMEGKNSIPMSVSPSQSRVGSGQKWSEPGWKK